jgi:hypothetical protein
MSALAILKDAAECSMHVSLSGGSLAARAVRPAGYSDLEWFAAIADAKRLGYPPDGGTNARRPCGLSQTQRRDRAEPPELEPAALGAAASASDLLQGGMGR